MPIIDTNVVVYIVLGIFLFILIIDNILMYLSYSSNIKYLEVLLEEQPSVYFEKVDKYVNKARSKVGRNMLLSSKLVGIIKLKSWENLETVIEEIDFNNLPVTWKVSSCINTLSLIMLDRIKDAKKMVDKLNKIASKNKRFIEARKLVNVVINFNDVEAATSMRELHELLKVTGMNEYEKSITYYYLALTTEKVSDKTNSTEYFTKAKVFGKNTVIEKLAQNKLFELHKNDCGRIDNEG